MVESVIWTIDWNPDFEDEDRLKREVMTALRKDPAVRTVKRFADLAWQHAVEDDLETEHIVWLDGSSTYAFFVRVWYETSEDKLFLVVEENDLGDVGFVILDSHDCASYAEERALTVEVRDPGDVDLGVEP